MTGADLFHTETPLAQGLRDILTQLEARLSLTGPLDVYLAGGMAVHLYTAERVTTDVDAEFAGRVFLPLDLAVDATLDDGSSCTIFLDTNYNAAFALLHEDYRDGAVPIDFGLKHLRIHVLSPVDLAVSKIARFCDHDKEDIQSLVRHGLVTADEIERRALAALSGFVGGKSMLRLNINDAVNLARTTENKVTRECGPSP